MISNMHNSSPAKVYTKETTYALGNLKIIFESDKIKIVQDGVSLAIPSYLARDILEIFKLELEPINYNTPVYRGLRDFEKRARKEMKPFKEFKYDNTTGDFQPTPSINYCETTDKTTDKR